MHELYEDLEEMCEVLADELNKTNEKLEKSGGQMSAGDLEYVNKLTHSIKSIKTTMAMIEAEDDGYSNNMSYEDGRSYRNSYNRGGSYRGSSYARGRGSNARRDSRGRYSSRGYSMDDGMIMELKELMQEAPDENTRKEFQKFISKMESM